MEQRRLGPTGVRVSELCLGTMTFGNEADEATSTAIVDRFLDAGGNFVDTANVYSAGRSEEITGRALGTRRDERDPRHEGPLRHGRGPQRRRASRAATSAGQVEASLRRLGTEWIDLYQVHCWDARTPLEETISTLDDLVHEGKVRYVGASNFAGWHLRQGARHRGAARLGAVRQPPARVLAHHTRHRARAAPAVSRGGPCGPPVEPARRRDPERQVPQGRGLPDRDPRRGHREPDHVHVPARRPRVERRRRGRQGRSRESARPRRRSRSTGWRTGPGVTAPIIGARNVTQLDDNLAAVGWQLEKPQRDTLAWAQRVPPGLPLRVHPVRRALAVPPAASRSATRPGPTSDPTRFGVPHRRSGDV